MHLLMASRSYPHTRPSSWRWGWARHSEATDNGSAVQQQMRCCIRTHPDIALGMEVDDFMGLGIDPLVAQDPWHVAAFSVEAAPQDGQRFEIEGQRGQNLRTPGRPACGQESR